MPVAQLRGNLDFLYPPFRDRVFTLLARCNDMGKVYYMTEGHRTYARSKELYRAYQDGGPRAAPPGASGHNFGLAADFVLDKSPNPGLQPDWGTAAFETLVQEARKLGLSPGAAYKDYPHVEWPTFISGEQLAPLAAIYKKAKGQELDKLKQVWAYCDSLAPNLPALE